MRANHEQGVTKLETLSVVLLVAVTGIGAFSALGATSSETVAGRSDASATSIGSTPALTTSQQAGVGSVAGVVSRVRSASRSIKSSLINRVQRIAGASPSGTRTGMEPAGYWLAMRQGPNATPAQASEIAVTGEGRWSASFRYAKAQKEAAAAEAAARPAGPARRHLAHDNHVAGTDARSRLATRSASANGTGMEPDGYWLAMRQGPNPAPTQSSDIAVTGDGRWSASFRHAKAQKEAAAAEVAARPAGPARRHLAHDNHIAGTDAYSPKVFGTKQQYLTGERMRGRISQSDFQQRIAELETRRPRMAETKTSPITRVRSWWSRLRGR